MNHPSDWSETCERCKKPYRKYPYKQPKHMCDKCQRAVLGWLNLTSESHGSAQQQVNPLS